MRRALLSLVAAGSLVVPATASALDYAPVDRPGPALQVPQSELDASLHCTGGVAGATRNPALLVAGTAEDPPSEFDWNYEPALDAAGIPWCAVTLPDHGLGDIQIAAEYVVNAIRAENQLSGRQIAIIGHSQGGMLPRWALRFWPDTRAMVDDLIALAPSNHGTIDANGACAGGCAPAVWQQRNDSQFIKALNSFQETFPGISYTVAYTHTDEIVTPNLDSTGSSSLHGGGGQIANIAIQEVCPNDVNEHFGIGSIDAVGWALALDALDNAGPADKSRISATVCAQPFMPGVNPVSGGDDYLAHLNTTFTNFGTAATVPAEPPLQCYVTIVCRVAPVPSGPAAANGGGAYGPAKTVCHRKAKRKHGHRKRKGCRRKNKKKKQRKRAQASPRATNYAPVDTPGPALSVPQSQLDASLECDGAVDNATVTPVMLLPGTGATPNENFSWNWEPALTDLGIPWCAVTLPGNALEDIQVAGEYVVNGIRSMFHRAGRRIAIVGHSQGGMVPRWALRFWPDTRGMVDDVIGLAPSNHGAAGAAALCAPGCPPADWQQSADSEFIKALNSGQETFPGISYTVIYTHNDEIVTPNSDDTGSSSLHGGGGQIENVAVQDVCPLDAIEHFGIGTVDPAAWALAVDALSHPGPAVPGNVPSSICPPANPFMPGVNPATAATDVASAATRYGQNQASGVPVSEEPPLKCYVTASCPGGSADGTATSVTKVVVGSPGSKCRKAKKRRHGHRKRKRCGRKKGP